MIARMTAERTIPFRIHLTGLPPTTCGPHQRIEAGIQRGDDVLPGAAGPDGSLVFAGELRLKSPARPDAPVFLGAYAFGPPGQRFLYLSWSGEENGKREMFRRMKIPLGSITWAQVDALRAEGSVLEVSVAGTGRDGGPACATVPLLGDGWQVVKRH